MRYHLKNAPFPTVGHILSLSRPLLCSPFQSNHFLLTVCCLNSTVRMTCLNTPLPSNVIFPRLITLLSVRIWPYSTPTFLLLSKIIVITHKCWMLPEHQALGWALFNPLSQSSQSPEVSTVSCLSAQVLHL